MTKYNIECLCEYHKALLKAERLLNEAEHDMFMVEEVKALYDVSLSLREALVRISYQMYEEITKIEEIKG